MSESGLVIHHFSTALEGGASLLEAVCIECGPDLIVVVGGGSRYHVGAVALSLSLLSLKDTSKLTNSTYQVPVPGHKEEALAREGSLALSRSLRRNVLLSVGIHEENPSRERISYLTEQFFQLVQQIQAFYQPDIH
ncbi:MAG: hypothetical protein MUE67_00155 [Anaerolineales bacterium]|jgi:hypothetical protein|nr:hypothetical protein [Anaerolineales bacterium]